MHDDQEIAYQKAHADALASPLLPEQVPGLPSDPVAAAEHLRAVQIATEERAGPEIIGLIKDIAHRNTGGSSAGRRPDGRLDPPST